MNDIANNNSLWNRLVAYGEENRFGVISMALLIVGCLSGSTMAFGAAQYTFSLIAVVIPTMSTLSLILAVAPMRLIYFSFIAAVMIDLIVTLTLVL